MFLPSPDLIVHVLLQFFYAGPLITGRWSYIRLVLIFFWSFSDLGNEAERNDISGYHMVAFSYGASSESTEQKNTDAESSFQPPFTVPEQLTQNLVGRWPCCCFLFTYFICPDVVCLVLI